MKIKLFVNRSNVVVLGFSKLLVFDKAFFHPQVGESFFAELGYAFYYRVPDGTSLPASCDVSPFITKKDQREALRITPGGKYLLDLSFGRGSRKWDNWEKRRFVQHLADQEGDEPVPSNDVLFSEAIGTSNGGGAWQECQIWLNGTKPLSKETVDILLSVSEK